MNNSILPSKLPAAINAIKAVKWLLSCFYILFCAIDRASIDWLKLLQSLAAIATIARFILDLFREFGLFGMMG